MRYYNRGQHFSKVFKKDFFQNEVTMIPSLLQFIAGGLLVGAGKKLYWFFVGICGAICGLLVSEVFFHPTGWWERVLVAIGFGAAFAILALMLQRIMVSIAGFIAGGFILVSLAETLQLAFVNWSWIVFIIGGIVGILLVQVLFDLALVLITSFGGASIIIRAAGLEGVKGTILLLSLVLIGIIIQSTQNRPKAPVAPPVTK
jgi:MFS family permease